MSLKAIADEIAWVNHEMVKDLTQAMSNFKTLTSETRQCLDKAAASYDRLSESINETRIVCRRQAEDYSMKGKASGTRT